MTTRIALDPFVWTRSSISGSAAGRHNPHRGIASLRVSSDGRRFAQVS